MIYAIRVTNEIKAQVENLNINVKGFGPMSTISAGSGSKNDDSTSMGQQTTKDILTAHDSKTRNIGRHTIGA